MFIASVPVLVFKSSRRSSFRNAEERTLLSQGTFNYFFWQICRAICGKPCRFYLFL